MEKIRTAKIKLCGLTRPEDIQTVNQYRPDYIGFVFAPASRRYITPRQAAELKKQLSPDITAVGVFVNADFRLMARLMHEGTIAAAQLHGQETEAVIRRLKTETGRPVIKAVSVRSADDIARWSQSQADFLLLDHGSGGTGRAFDWDLAAVCTKPFFLAGGICAASLLPALTKGAYAVDLSSGAETGGRKDPAKIAEIMRIIRAQNNFKKKNLDNRKGARICQMQTEDLAAMAASTFRKH